MDEKTFWWALELRVARELSGLRKRHLGALWCDGISPGIYLLAHQPPRIEGAAWIGYDETVPWHFTLLLPGPVRSLEEIDWSSLVPPDDGACWLGLDESRRVLHVEPAAAVFGLGLRTRLRS